MGGNGNQHRQQPRELRRRVVLPARLRTGARWSDTCILNVSTRGLMIHSSSAAQQGEFVELCRGDYQIRARIMWRDGARVGLRSDTPLRVDEILALGQTPDRNQPQVGACSDRRQQQPIVIDSRLRGRLWEFAGVAVIAASLAASAFMFTGKVLARPLAAVAHYLPSEG